MFAGCLLRNIYNENAMKNSESSAGGYIVLAMLVVMLAVPVLAGHYALAKQPEASLHAEVAAK